MDRVSRITLPRRLSSVLRPLSSAFRQQRLDLGAELRGDVVAGKRVGDIGGEEADLGAAVEGAALELESVERLLAREPDHRVSELDLAAGAPSLRPARAQWIRSGF